MFCFGVLTGSTRKSYLVSVIPDLAIISEGQSKSFHCKHNYPDNKYLLEWTFTPLHPNTKDGLLYNGLPINSYIDDENDLIINSSVQVNTGTFGCRLFAESGEGKGSSQLIVLGKKH